MARAATNKPKTAKDSNTSAKKTSRSRQNCILSYYQAIKNGDVTVGRWIELLYEKIVGMIESKELIYSSPKAYVAIDYIETHCYHTEGVLAPGALRLELWQKAFLSCVFGLLDPQTKLRAFREVVLLVGRKNGKSALAAAIAKYIFEVDGGFGARVYCIAPKLDQAEIIYNGLWQMCILDTGSNDGNKKDPTKPRHRMTDLFIEKTNSTAKKLAFSSRKSDGFNPSLAVCDEVAAWPGANGLKQYEVMKSGMGARPEALMLSCTTAGYEHEGIYDELLKRSSRFLLGESKEKRLLPFLYMIDDVERWNDINELAKANPNLGTSVSVDYLLDEIAVAEQSYSKKNEFICKYANIQQNASIAWLAAQDVEAICGDTLKLDDFRECYAVCGVDLSQAVDLTCATCVIERDDNLYVFAQFFMPRDRIDEAIARDGIPYNAYIQRGILTPSGDKFIDYHDVENWITRLVSEYHIYPLKIGFDKYSATYFVQDLKGAGYHMDDVFQGENLYSTILETQGMIEERRINIGDNDLLKAHLLNSAIKMSVERGRGKLVKIAATMHIDGTAALLDAMVVRQKWYAEIGEQLKNKE